LELKSNNIAQFLRFSFSGFLLLCALSIPFTWALFPWHDQISQAIFLYPIKEISELFNVPLVLEDFSSDTKALLILLFLNLVLTFILGIFIFKVVSKERFIQTIRLILTYYLALVLLKYGADKLFKSQFYLPEPNLLYTPVGKLDRDILYWSTMGTSRSYNIFMGLAEIIPGLMLLFFRTRIPGLILSLFVLINVIAVNFSFDISVKIFSCFLLLIILFLFQPYFKFLWNTLVLQKATETPLKQRNDPGNRLKLVKSLILVLIFIEVLHPYFSTSNFNDDKAARPFLHGAYELQKESSISNIKRVFVHRNGYLIFQDEEDNFVDYRLEIDRKSRLFVLTDYDLKTKLIPFRYNSGTGILELFPNTNKMMSFSTLNWKDLPLLKEKWHLTID